MNISRKEEYKLPRLDVELFIPIFEGESVFLLFILKNDITLY